MVQFITIVSTLSYQNFKFYLVTEAGSLIHLHPISVNFLRLKLSPVTNKNWMKLEFKLALPPMTNLMPFFICCNHAFNLFAIVNVLLWTSINILLLESIVLKVLSNRIPIQLFGY